MSDVKSAEKVADDPPDVYGCGYDCGFIGHTRAEMREHRQTVHALEYNQYYLQVKGYSGNSLLWWCKGRHGYTTDISKAHVFTKEEAFAQARVRPTEDFPWRKEYIDAHLTSTVNCEHVKRADPEAT